MTAIELTFPAGRFHATPWGRHVNEGAVEWPPSPWRLLRALVATWKRKAPHLDEAIVRNLLTALSAPPEFALPPATFGHTRHYMPPFKGKRTLVFDSFVALGKEDPLLILWPEVELPEEQSAALAELLPLLGTLGRAESWCQGRLLTDAQLPEADTAINCRPLNGHPPTGEVVRVLGCDPATAFSNEHTPPRREATSGRGKGKTTVVTPLYDPDWHLCIETLWLHQQRWSMPPGAAWLDYERAKDALAQPKPRTVRLPTRPPMHVARFALDSAVLPLLTDTLRVAESARIVLMSRHGRLTERDGVRGKSRIFAGKEDSGTPIKDHSHCYFLPTDEDGDGRLDHLTLFAAGGFGPDELRAIDTLRQIKTRDTEDSGHPLGVILLGMGVAPEFAPGPLKASSSWISATPFLAPDHPKTRGRWRDTERGGSDPHRFLLAQIRKELTRWLERHDLDIPLDSIEASLCLDGSGNIRRLDRRTEEPKERSIQFRRFRQKRGDDGGRRLAGFFKLTFPEAVPGPLALGYSSHFGLGLFLPSD
ncbi:MAG: type I-U CRISPR-associated protein Csb2 [Verrucomicrobiales bacterium]